MNKVPQVTDSRAEAAKAAEVARFDRDFDRATDVFLGCEQGGVPLLVPSIRSILTEFSGLYGGGDDVSFGIEEHTGYRCLKIGRVTFVEVDWMEVFLEACDEMPEGLASAFRKMYAAKVKLKQLEIDKMSLKGQVVRHQRSVREALNAHVPLREVVE